MRAYATFVTGDPDVVAYDDKFRKIEAKRVLVQQPANELYDKKKKKHVLELGRMTIKADGLTYECIDFKKFDSQAGREEWLAQEQARVSESS